MKLEFNIYELVPKTRFGRYIDKQGIKELIVVGSSKIGDIESYKAHDIKDGPLLISGNSIQDTAFDIPKNELKLKGNGAFYETCEMDIPKEFLDMEIIKEIQKLNERS